MGNNKERFYINGIIGIALKLKDIIDSATYGLSSAFVRLVLVFDDGLVLSFL